MLAELQQQGLIRHLGVSTVTAEQVAEAQSIAPVACVQNFYNIAHRVDDELVDSLAAQGIAYVPYFPLGGFSPLQSDALNAVAARLGATPMAVALAWLLQRSPNILLIPGTSSIVHLRENIAGATAGEGVVPAADWAAKLGEEIAGDGPEHRVEPGGVDRRREEAGRPRRGAHHPGLLHHEHLGRARPRRRAHRPRRRTRLT